MDAFYVQCLRRILGIHHSFYSRVANATVLEKAGRRNLMEKIIQEQISLFRQVEALTPDAICRCVALEPGGRRPKVWPLKRGQGRPRTRWTRAVFELLL